jgi:transcriptional regulator with XRE-family HTH domain/predicted Zn-ribbon and HTH transcriptional regulator
VKSNEPIGRQLRSLRQLRGLSLREVAEKTGCSLRHLCCLEHDRNSPTIGTLSTLLRAYGSTLAEFFVLNPPDPDTFHLHEQLQSIIASKRTDTLAAVQILLNNLQPDSNQFGGPSTAIMRARPAHKAKFGEPSANPTKLSRFVRRGKIFGCCPSTLVRWLGSREFTPAQAQAVLTHYGVSLADSGIKWQLRAGRSRVGVYARVAVPKLPETAQKELLRFKRTKRDVRDRDESVRETARVPTTGADIIKTLPQLRCQRERCGYVWVPRIGNPKRCPRCKQNWQKPLKDFRTGHPARQQPS